MSPVIKIILIALAVLAAAIAATALFSRVVTNTFLSVATKRKVPKSIKQMKRAMAGFSQWTEEVYKAQAEYSDKMQARDYEVVETTAYDGIKLVGHYKKIEGAKRTVVCFHGWRSIWSRDYGLISEFLEANECSVLYVEQRAQGESEGEYIGFGLLERYDCKTWADYVVSLGDGLPIYLYGISLGAATVMMGSGQDLPDQVHGIIADCGFTSPNAILKHVITNNLHMTFTPLRKKQIERICRRDLNSEDSGYSSADALKKSKTPVLFIHGTLDNFVPIDMTYENYLACAAPKRLLIVPGADHGLSYLAEQEKYQQTVKDFWREFD